MNDFDTGKRYPALSAIVVAIKVIAVLVTLIGGLVAFSTMQFGVSAASIGIMVGVVVAFVIMWAVAESIPVIIDIEANTRPALSRRRERPIRSQLSNGLQPIRRIAYHR